MKIIFWNVDTQYDFIGSKEYKGTLVVPKAREIEDNLEKLTDYAEKNNIQVVNTADMHDKDSQEISENPDFKTTFPEHCIRGTLGAAFIPATNPRNPYIVDWKKDLVRFDPKLVKNSRNITIFKDHFDVFQGNPYTEKILQVIKPNKAVVYGVATNVCVNYAVKGLLERNVEVYVPLDAIKELPNLPLPYKEWQELRAKLVATKDVLEGKLNQNT